MTEISIKNFQSISSASLTVDGFTLVIGKNNIGKSAVVRAINAALTNQTGSEFIRTGTKTAEVSLKKDGLDIHWKKGAKASYVVNKETFTALNRGVPKPITDAGFKNIEMDDLKVNPLYAPQFEDKGNGPVFLLNRPGPQVTEILSKVYDIDVISRADDLCQKEIRSVKTLLKTRTTDLGSLDNEMERFKNMGEVKETLTALHDINARCATLKLEVAEIDLMITEMGKLTRSIANLKRITEVDLPDPSQHASTVDNYQWLSVKSEEFVHLSRKVEELGRIKDLVIPDGSGHDAEVQAVEYLKKANKELRLQAVTVKGLKGISNHLNESLPNLSSKSGSVENGISDMKWILSSHGELATAAASVRKLKQELETTGKELALAEEERSSYKMCPACGNPLNGGKS